MKRLALAMAAAVTMMAATPAFAHGGWRRGLTAAILDGRQPRSLSVSALIERPLPHSWDEQRAAFAALT